MKRLRDPEDGASSLNAALEENDELAFQLALQDVAEARNDDVTPPALSWRIPPGGSKVGAGGIKYAVTTNSSRDGGGHRSSGNCRGASADGAGAAEFCL